MCEEIRNYYEIVHDDGQVARLVRLDNAITDRGDWEFWSDGVPEDNETFARRVAVYGVADVTRQDMEIISEIARLGWFGFVRSRDLEMAAYLNEMRPRERDFQ